MVSSANEKGVGDNVGDREGGLVLVDGVCVGKVVGLNDVSQEDGDCEGMREGESAGDARGSKLGGKNAGLGVRLGGTLGVRLGVRLG